MKTNNNIPAYRFQGYTDAWDLRKLGEIFQVSSGQTPSRQDEENFSSPDVPWVKTLDLTNSAILESEEFISNKASQKLKLFPNGTVLIAMYGGLNQIGRTGLLTFPSTINQAISALPPSDEILPYYLIYHLNSKIGVWRSLAASSRKDPNITKTDVENFKISFPALPEQEAIGTFFSTLDQHITLHQRKLDTLKEQKKTYLKLLFPAKGQTQPALRFQGFEDDWKEVKLGDTCTKFTDGNYGESYPKDSDLTTSLSGVPFLRGSNIQAGKLSLDNANYITISKHNELTSGHLEEDDIVIAVRGSLGSVGYVEVANIGWNINSQLAIIRTQKEEILGRFLIQILMSEFGKKIINSLVTGTALKQLPIKNLKTIQIQIPTLPEQSAIGTFFQTLDQEIAQVEDKLASLKEMKKTLLRKLFVS